MPVFPSNLKITFRHLKSVFSVSIALACFSLAGAPAAAQSFEKISLSFSPSFNAQPEDVSHLEWLDADDDGDLDAMVFTSSAAYGKNFYLYKNTGGSFTYVTGFLTNTSDYSFHHYAVGDYDADGDIDFLVVKYGQELWAAINNADMTFTRLNTGITITDYGLFQWLDVDGDADLDILSGNTTFIYTNGVFSQVESQFPSSVSERWWVDLNNDGLLDIVCAQNQMSLTYALRAFINKGHLKFGEPVTLSNEFYDFGIVNWFDADGDDDLDLLISERDQTCTILRNQIAESGQLTFQRGFSVGGFLNPGAIISDVDMDGRPDMILHEDVHHMSSSHVYRNISTNTALNFELDESLLTAERIRDMDVIDLNNDQKPDLFFGGLRKFEYMTGKLSDVFSNTSVATTSAPVVPTNLQSEVQENVRMSWDHDKAGNSVYYNLEIRKDGQLRKAALARLDGSTVNPGLLHLISVKGFAVYDLPAGSYEWKVQAFDHAYRASGFSTVGSFEIAPAPANFSIENVSLTTAKLTWTYPHAGNPQIAIFRATESESFVEIANLPAGTTSFTDQNLENGKRFQYFIRAVSNGAYSERSEIADFHSTLFVKKNFQSSLVMYGGGIADFDLDDDYDVGFINGRAVNDGSGEFTIINSLLPQDYSYTSQTFRDIDNDGDTDACVGIRDIFGEKVLTFLNTAGVFSKSFESDNYQGILQYALEDINQDGRLDIFLSVGIVGPKSYQLFLQSSDGSFVKSNHNFLSESGEHGGSFYFADLNSDGYVDIFFSREGEPPRIVQNIDGDRFVDVETTLPKVGSPFFADFNGDGKIDLLTGDYPIQLYSGNGDFSFSPPVTIEAEMSVSSMCIADFDLDGLPDILANNTSFIHLLRNNGNGTFEVNAYDFGEHWSSIHITDIERDGDVDIVRLGSNYGEASNILYTNNAQTTLTQKVAPAAPTGLIATAAPNGVAISWNGSSDDTTPANYISYNLSVTDAQGKAWLHPETNASGTFNRRFGPGNAGYKTFFNLDNVPAGEYSIRVQAVDAAFASSVWSDEITLTIEEGPSQLSVERIKLNKVILEWVDGPSLQNTTQVLRASTTSGFQLIAELPPGVTSYTDENLHYENIYTYKVVEKVNGIFTASSNEVSWNTAKLRLAESDFPDFNGSLDVGDFTGDGRMDIAVATNETTSVFENSATGWLPSSIGGAANMTFTFEDLNGDHKLDLYKYHQLSFSAQQTETFINKGDKSFSSETNVFTAEQYRLLAWWDIDIDGDGDAYVSQPQGHHILKNGGAGIFQQSSTVCPGCSGMQYFFGDFDKDGDQDVVEPYLGRYIIKLNGFHGLIPADTLEPWFIEREGFTLDYNGDGWLDIFILSKDENGAKSTLFRNNGIDLNGKLTFKIERDDFPRGSNVSANWIDHEHDGDLDLFITGLRSFLYVNNGSGDLQEVTLPTSGWGFKRPQWIDIDNDGDHDLVVPGPNMNRNVFVNHLIDEGTGDFNAAPAVPTNLRAMQDSSGLYLQWDPGLDDHTTATALTFDVVFFKDGKAITTGLLDPLTGNRVKPAPGKSHGSAYLKTLAPGEYTWKVQAVDQSYASSPLSEAVNILVRPLQPVISGDTTIYYCSTFPVLSARGENIEWFSDKAATAKIASGDFEVKKSQVVYVTQTVNGIKGFVKRVKINLVYHVPKQPTFSVTNPLPFCEYEAGFTATVSAVGNAIRWYADSTLTQGISGDKFLVIKAEERTFYVTNSTYGCESKPVKFVVFMQKIESTVVYDRGQLKTLEDKGDYYEWFFNEETIPGSNSQSIALGEPGSYVAGIIKGYCYEFSDPFIITDIEQTEQEELSIFPNPVVTDFVIEIPYSMEGTVTITNVDGRIIFEQAIQTESPQQLSISSSTWPAGLYILTVSDQKKKVSYKLMKL